MDRRHRLTRIVMCSLAALATLTVLAASETTSVMTAPPAAAAGNAPSCIYTPSDFASAFLDALGEPQSPANLEFILAWEQAEGGNWKNTAKFNPLDTTQPYDGSVPFEQNAPVPVQAYQNWNDGVQATVITITNGYYANILAALANGSSVSADVSALANSPWGTGNISPDIPPDYAPTAPPWETPCGAASTDTSGWQWVPTPTASTSGSVAFCRPVGAGPDFVQSYVSCDTYVPGHQDFEADSTSPLLDWGYDGGRGWLAMGSSQSTDYCRRGGVDDNVGSYVLCTWYDGSEWTSAASSVLDWGYDNGAQWIPLSNGKADYCRLAGVDDNVDSYLLCTPFNGATFGTTVASGIVDWGYQAGAEWVAGPNGTVDFCRRAGVNDNVGSYVLCTPFNGTSFGPTSASGILDWGYDVGAQWVAGPNGTIDYCREAGVQDNVGSYVLCTPFNTTTGTFGATSASGILDWGYAVGVQWAAGPNGTIDFCRRGGGGTDTYLLCNPFNATAGTFGPFVSSAVPTNWGYDAGAQWVSVPNGTVDYCAWATAATLTCDSFNGSNFSAQVASRPGAVSWGFDT